MPTSRSQASMELRRADSTHRIMSAARIAAVMLAAPLTTKAPGRAQEPVPSRQELSIAGFSTPVSVRHDPDQDVYFVSNVNGVGDAHDNNGFISRVRPDGRVEARKWIAGGQGGVRLDAPKGLLLRGDTLWVSDVDTVRAFDRRTGHPLIQIGIPAAVFLNGVALGPDGAIYVTDTGLRFQADGTPRHVGPDRIYRIRADRHAEAVLSAADLGAPTGIAWSRARGEFIIAPLNSRGVLGWRPGEKTPRVVASGAGDFDGAFTLMDGHTIVLSQAGTVSLLAGNRLVPLLTGLRPAADIGVDEKRHRLLVPLLLDDCVSFWTLAGSIKP